jgi:hypothetical protein
MERGELKRPDHLPAILARYGNPETTPLNVEIHSDKQELHLQLD